MGVCVFARVRFFLTMCVSVCVRVCVRACPLSIKDISSRPRRASAVVPSAPSSLHVPNQEMKGRRREKFLLEISRITRTKEKHVMTARTPPAAF